MEEKRFIQCSECRLSGTPECWAVKTFEKVVLTEDSGCTEGTPKEADDVD